jgi:hypothetical protein
MDSQVKGAGRVLLIGSACTPFLLGSMTSLSHSDLPPSACPPMMAPLTHAPPPVWCAISFPEYPEDFKQLVVRMMAMGPEQRPTMGEVVHTMRALRHGANVKPGYRVYALPNRGLTDVREEWAEGGTPSAAASAASVVGDSPDVAEEGNGPNGVGVTVSRVAVVRAAVSLPLSDVELEELLARVIWQADVPLSSLPHALRARLREPLS